MRDSTCSRNGPAGSPLTIAWTRFHRERPMSPSGTSQFHVSLLSLAFASLCFGLTDRSTDRISGEKRLHRRIQLLYGDSPGPNQALGNCLFDTLNDLRDAALAALDSINPPNLFTYLCPRVSIYRYFTHIQGYLIYHTHTY